MAGVTEVGTPAAAATQVGSNSPSVTPSWGSGQNRTAGDLLVCVTTNWGGTTGGTPVTPSGWTQALTVMGSSRAVVTYFTKVATGSDSAPTISATNTGTATFSTLVAKLYEFSGQDGTTPVPVTGTSTGTTVNPLVTTTSSNVPAANCFALGANVITITGTATSTLGAGSGWTDEEDNGSTSTRAHWLIASQANPTSGATLSESVSYTGTGAFLAGGIIVIQPSASQAGAASLSGSGSLSSGATQGVQASLSGSGSLTAFSGFGVASLSGSGTLNGPLGLRSAAAVTTGAASATLNVPAQQVAVGDLILIWAAVGFPAITFTSAGGDSLTAEAANDPATTPQMSTQLFHKIADSSDVAKAAASGSYTITASVSHPWSAIIAVVPVTSTAHPFDPSDTPGSGQSNAASTSADAAGITTTVNAEVLLWLGAVRNTAGGVPPTMTVPSGYTAPGSVTQVNSSGSGTANVGVMLAQMSQSVAGSTGTVSGTYTGSQVSGGLLLAIKAAPVTNLPGTVAHLASGAPTSSGFQVIAKTNQATSVRLAYSVNSNMSSPSFVAAQTPDSLGYVRYTAAGLSAHTQYYYQLMDTPSGGSEVAIGGIGQARTLPPSGSAQSFTVALVSCVAEQDTTAPPALDAAMSDWNSYSADLNLFTGDFDYSGTTSTDTPTQVGVYETQIGTYAQYATMLANNWGFYCRSDHEAGPDNGDSDNAYTATNIAAAQEVFPFGVLGDTVNNPVHGLYQAWVVGRVRFIMIDIRNTDRSPGSNTDNSSKTMLGATQLAWLQAQLIEPEPLKVIVGDVAWMGPASITNGPDKWWSYDTERQAIIAYMAANAAQVQGVMYWHGDSHLVGCTPGPQNAYGGFPVYCAAPMLNVGGGLNTGTFTQFYNNSGGECRLYGRIAITDDGAKISVNFQGWDAVNAVAQVQQTDIFQTGQFTGSGSLTAGPKFTGSASLSGSGSLSATLKQGVQASLSGSGTLTASPVFAGTASLSGSGTISATGVKGFTGTAALSGSGALTASWIELFAGAASLSGSGSLTAAESIGGASLSGSGTLSAAETLLTGATLSGSGSLGASQAFAGAASLSGAGSLTSSAAEFGAAALSGSGSLSALWKIAQQSALSGLGTLLAGYTVAGQGSASLSGSGVLTATGSSHPQNVPATGVPGVVPGTTGTSTVLNSNIAYPSVAPATIGTPTVS